MDKDNLPYYPNVVKIEFTQGCNRHCKFCGVNGIADSHFLTEKTLRKIITVVTTANREFRIELGMHGEPLLNPNAMLFLKTIKATLPKCWVQLITNGDKVRDKTYDIADLLHYVDDLAMDCYDMSISETYGEAAELQERFPDVDVEVMQNGVGFYAEKKKNYKRILLIPPLDIQTNMDVRSRKIKTHCGAGVNPAEVVIKKDKRCHLPFRQLAFRWDGKVAICCDDFRGELPIVDVMDENIQHFADVWWHPVFNACRRIIFHKGRYLTPCNKCNDPGNRLGLLPDPMGKMTLREPTKEDFELWQNAVAAGPLAKIKKREWE